LAPYEIAHELQVKQLRGLFVKLDFEKAHDKVNLEFPREMLLRKGFSAGGGSPADAVGVWGADISKCQLGDWCILPQRTGSEARGPIIPTHV
jgi:hypothetical protein